MSRKPIALGATPENAINEGAEMQHKVPRKSRTKMYTARIVRAQFDAISEVFAVLNNGKCTAQFVYFSGAANCEKIANNMGQYEGFPRFYRDHIDEFSTVLITKSEDETVTSTQADPVVAEEFVRRYIDNRTAKQLAAQKENNLIEPSTRGASVIEY